MRVFYALIASPDGCSLGREVEDEKETKTALLACMEFCVTAAASVERARRSVHGNPAPSDPISRVQDGSAWSGFVPGGRKIIHRQQCLLSFYCKIGLGAFSLAVSTNFVTNDKRYRPCTSVQPTELEWTPMFDVVITPRCWLQCCQASPSLYGPQGNTSVVSDRKR